MITDQGVKMNGEDSTMLSGENEFKLQVIHRVMKKALPNHALVSKDAKSFIEEKVVALIQNVTRKAKEVAGKEHRTKIKGEDVVSVFQNSGLFLYGNVLDAYMQAEKNRDTPSVSTEAGTSEEDEKMKETGGKNDLEISDMDVPEDATQDASDEDMFSDHMVSDCTSDQSDYFEVPQAAQQTCLSTIESDDNEIFGTMDDVDLEGEEDIFSDCIRMPDSWIRQIAKNLKDGANSPSPVPGTSDGADATSDLPTPISVPSWTSRTRPTSGYVTPSIRVPPLNAHVGIDADIDADENDILAAGISSVGSPSPGIRGGSIPSWTITPTIAPGVRIPSVHFASSTVRKLDKDDLETNACKKDMTGVTNLHEQSGEEPSDHNWICGAQDDWYTAAVGEIEQSRTGSVEAEQILTQQETIDPFVFDLDPDGFDTEALFDYPQGLLDE